MGTKLGTTEALNDCLVAAICRRNSDMITKLCLQGANVSDKTVIKAAIMYPSDSFHTLLTSTRHKEATPCGLNTDVLIWAICHRHSAAEKVRLLLQMVQVDIHGFGRCGHRCDRTPLGAAIKYCRESLSIVVMLLDAGCNPNDIAECYEPYISKFRENETALLLEINSRRKDLVELLINRGARVNEPAKRALKRTPLQKAAEVGSLEIVVLLLNEGADVNGMSAVRNGGTALQFAAISGNCNIAAMLLSRGARLDTPPPRVNGRWPLEGAAEHGRLAMIEFLWKVQDHLACAYPDGLVPGFEPDICQNARKLAEEY
ncbi:ankyrin repeat-containing domain protein [Xylariaceae sp. FL0016]|nr:ankyrin repeat-containing domain protein [Xylariaceae sp. FL0016]